MKLTNSLLASIFIIFLLLTGCTSAFDPATGDVAASSTAVAPEDTRPNPPAPTPIALQPTSTATPLLPTSTATVMPTRTAFPTGTPTRRPVTPVPTTPRPTPTATETPSPTPTLYPDAWVAGLLWDEERTILYVGNSSGVIYDSRISYEPLNETVAATIARYPKGTLVVFYGDYTPLDRSDGHMVVERVEQVNLPYSADTPLTAVYTHPHNLFAFAYPSGWTLTAENEDRSFVLVNRPPENQQYMGPGIEYRDPTTVYLTLQVRTMSLEAYVQSRQEKEITDEDASIDVQLMVSVNQHHIGEQQVTQIDEESPLWGTTRHYALSLNEDQILVITTTSGDAPFVERLLATLSIP